MGGVGITMTRICKKKEIQRISISIKCFLFFFTRAGVSKVGSSPSLQNKDPGGGVGSTSRGWRLVGLGWRWVGLGVGMGGFRDQGVETGRFR